MSASRKRKHHHKKHSSKFNFRKLYWVFAIILALIGSAIIGHYVGYQSGLRENTYFLKMEKQRTTYLYEQLKQQTVKTAKHEYADQSLSIVKPPKAYKRPIKLSIQKPKLAIIIDDVSFKHDVRNIKEMGINLTMSFLPPNKFHPDSARLAFKEPFYMVHLPLEAQNFKAEEPSTLYVTDSQEKITQHIKDIKKLFPKVSYINNHTGSKFTSDKRAMNQLIYALNRENIHFIDSRTTGKTVVPEIMKNYGFRYISRDVFLDHDTNVEAVKKQIKRAIFIAKKHGSAIAIGHPHKKTLQALRESKELFNEVELVKINNY